MRIQTLAACLLALATEAQATVDQVLVLGDLTNTVTFLIRGDVPDTVVINLVNHRCDNQNKASAKRINCNLLFNEAQSAFEIKNRSGGDVIFRGTFYKSDRKVDGQNIGGGSNPTPQPVKLEPVTPPPASITSANVSPSTVNIGQSVNFTVYTSQPVIRGELRFDDGPTFSLNGSGTSWSYTHSISKDGQRQVKFVLWDSQGRQTESSWRTLIVNKPVVPISPTVQPVLPVNGFSADPHEMWRKWQDGTARVNTRQLRDGLASTLSPAEIIYFSALENNINPVLIMTKIQGEQSLIGSVYSGQQLNEKLELATGYGARIGAKWYGFYPQVVGLSYQFDLFAKQGMAFRTAYETYTQDSRGPYSQFQKIYADYAVALNRIAGTNFPTTPDDNGYYRDFRNLSPQQIQTCLQQMGGALANSKLFGGSGTVTSVTPSPVIPTPSSPTIVRIDPVTPLSGEVGKKVTFTVQGSSLPDTLVINLNGERCYNDSKPQANQVVCDVTKSGVNSQLQVKRKAGELEVLKTFSFTGITPVSTTGQIVYPLRDISINQHFGAYLGTYEGVKYNGYHTGTDLKGSVNTPVLAIADGIVSRIRMTFPKGGERYGGWFTVIDHPQIGKQSIYVHTQKPLVTVGNQIKAGQQIASLASMTKFNTHLHLEVKNSGKNILDSAKQPTIFVGQSTTPKGKNGYIYDKYLMNDIWVNPMTFISNSNPNAKAIDTAQPIMDINSIVHIHDDVQEDDPPVIEQVSRQSVLDQLGQFALRKNLISTGNVQEMQKLGVYQGATLSRPQEFASRMEAALMIQRLLEPTNPNIISSGNRFNIGEFGSTPEASEQDYQSVVNRLYQWGIINGQQDYLGEWRYYPTRKLSAYELRELINRSDMQTPALQHVSQPTTPPVPITSPIATFTPLGIGLDAPNPRVMQPLTLNLYGNIPDGMYDLYLYIKRESDKGTVLEWYYDRSFHGDKAKPWRSGISGPNLPETNPILTFTANYPGLHAAGAVLIPAGNQINLRNAIEKTVQIGM